MLRSPDGSDNNVADNVEIPAFPCPLIGAISTWPRRGTLNGAIIGVYAGKEMPLNLSGTEVRPVQLFVRYLTCDT